MEYVEFKEKTANTRLIRAKAILYDARDDIEFAKQWLKEKDTGLSLGTGFDDDEKHSLICVIPLFDGVELGEIYLTLDQIKQAHPELQPISGYLIDGFTSPFPCFQYIAEDRRRAIEDALDLVYNEDLAERLGKFEAVYELALSYAIDNVGEVNIRLADKEIIFEDCEPQDQSLIDSQLYFCDMHYQSPKPVGGMLPMFSESIYCTLD